LLLQEAAYFRLDALWNFEFEEKVGCEVDAVL
jgi:hypothetical protein